VEGGGGRSVGVQGRGGEIRPLERVRVRDAEEFHSLYVRPRRPVIVVGALDEWPEHLRSFAGLAQRCGEATVEVDLTGGHAFVFDRARRTRSSRARLADFVQGDEVASGYVQCRADEVTRRLDLAATRLPFAPRGSIARIESIWIGGGGGYGLHQDIGTDQLLCQLVGRKRVIMIEDSLGNVRALRLEPLRTGRFYRSRITDALSHDPSQTGALAGVPRLIDTLAPGEVLYIPCAWFHELRPLGPGVSVGHRHILPGRYVGSYLGSIARHVAASMRGTARQQPGTLS